MTLERILTLAIVPALGMFPSVMDSLPARALLLAIGLQESRFLHRRQLGGPAKSYWQFERDGGVRGVLEHAATRQRISAVLSALDYDPASDAQACYDAIEHNDLLACAFARLLLWTVPDALPAADGADRGWGVYLRTWRPGKPRRDTWDSFYARAWLTVQGLTNGAREAGAQQEKI